MDFHLYGGWVFGNDGWIHCADYRGFSEKCTLFVIGFAGFSETVPVALPNLNGASVALEAQKIAILRLMAMAFTMR